MNWDEPIICPQEYEARDLKKYSSTRSECSFTIRTWKSLLSNTEGNRVKEFKVKQGFKRRK